MSSYDELFRESKGQPIDYNGKILVLADKFPVSDGDTLNVSIEQTNSEYIQGLSIDITGSCEVQGKLCKKGKRVKMVFWEDSTVLDPKNFHIKVFTTTGFVWVQNLWERINPMGNKYIDSGHHGAAMIVEEIENGRRYRCNDGTPDEDFDDIVFTITREPR